MSAVHATPAHESGSSTKATSPFGSSGAAKKASGLAGLFSDMLSQAQKSLSLKGGEGENALATKIRIPDSHAMKQGLLVSHAAGNAHKTGEGRDTKLLIANRDRAKRGASKRSAAGAMLKHSESPAPKPEVLAHDRARAKPAGGTGAPVAIAPFGAEALDARRRAKDKGDAATSDAAAVLAAGSAIAAKAPADAAPGPRAKVGHRSDEELAADEKIEKRGSEPRLSVLDLRRSVESRSADSAKSAAAEESAKSPAIKVKAPANDAGREVYRELSLGPRGSGEAGSTAVAAKAEGGQAQDFRSMLAERLRDAWNGEIVQSARVVLREGDAGTIRLRLKPESLGNIKIELNLAENNISGRILVESDAAKSAFERNMSQLSDAFRQGGFDSARLEVAVGGGSGGSQNSRRDDGGGPFFSERMRGAVGSTADPATSASAYARRGGAVDILA